MALLLPLSLVWMSGTSQALCHESEHTAGPAVGKVGGGKLGGGAMRAQPLYHANEVSGRGETTCANSRIATTSSPFFLSPTRISLVAHCDWKQREGSLGRYDSA